VSCAARSRGTVLLFAVAAVVLIGALGTALVAVSLAADRAARRAELDAQLLNAAESGAEIAIHRLRNATAWTGARQLAVPGGACSVKIEKLTARVWRLTSRTSSPRRACRLTITVERTGAGRLRVKSWKSTSQ
jgi:Tfp pilus assembly protein PilX